MRDEFMWEEGVGLVPFAHLSFQKDRIIMGLPLQEFVVGCCSRLTSIIN